MAALNFPLSPNDGDVHGNYVYDATEGVWNANPQQLASRFVTSATQPTSPSNGDGWLDANTGKTYIYYNDGSSAQWIESGNPVIGFVDPYDQDSASTGYFSLPKGTSAQRPVAPRNGDIRFNTENDRPEWYSESTGAWVEFNRTPVFDLQYLVVAGGGGSNNWTSNSGPGAGAGGYRSSVIGESSGGGFAAETVYSIELGTYLVSVGAGGASGSNGSDSYFADISSIGGGTTSINNSTVGATGGSGGGGGYLNTTVRGQGTTGQGYDSGLGAGGGATDPSPGGGGAGAVGVNPVNNGSAGGAGGIGVASSITGSSVYRAGGGGGGDYSLTGGAGGLGGGGAGGGGIVVGSPGSANTGGGAGGGGRSSLGNSGGSGIVIIKYPSRFIANISVGLTATTSAVGDYKVTQLLAGVGTVTFS
jgi:hypothetical protein